MAVGELLWLPSASTPSLWVFRPGFIRLLVPPVPVAPEQDSRRVGERSPPVFPGATMENW